MAERLRVLHQLPNMQYGGTERICLIIAEASTFCDNVVYSQVPKKENDFSIKFAEAGIDVIFPDGEFSSDEFHNVAKDYHIVHIYGGDYPPDFCAGISNYVFNVSSPIVKHPVLCTSFSTLLKQPKENESYLFRCAINVNQFNVSLRKPHNKLNFIRVCRAGKSNISLLDQAVAKILDRFPDLGEYFVIGDSSGINHPKIHYLGWVNDVREYLAISDIFVYAPIHPNVWTCDIVVLEAMAFGLAVVSTNDWSVAEQIDHGETGILTDYSEESICQAIEYLCYNPTEVQRMGDLAYKRVLELFDIDKRMPLLEQIYLRSLEMKNLNRS